MRGTPTSGETWLAVRSVAGYAEADFEFLPIEVRTRLTQVVEEFRTVAHRQLRTAPLTDPRVVRATALFEEIGRLLEFDRYPDADALRLGKQIEAILAESPPEGLWRIRFRSGKDHSGDLGLWMVAVLRGRSKEAIRRRTDAIFPLLRSLVREVAPDYYPYVSCAPLSRAEAAERLAAKALNSSIS